MICAFGAVFAFWGAHAAMVTDGNVTWPHFCGVEQVSKYENLDGISFEVTDTGCDLLTKDEFVTVFVCSSRMQALREDGSSPIGEVDGYLSSAMTEEDLMTPYL